MADDSAQPKKILILHSGGIGDLLLALPALRIFRRNFPEAILELMGHPERLSPVAFDLRAESIHSIDQGGMNFFYLRGEPLPSRLAAFFSSFEIALLFEKTESILSENLRRAGVDQVISVPSFPPEGSKIHASDYLIESLKSRGLKGGDSFLPLRLPTDALAFAGCFWAKFGRQEGEKVLAIHPGSGSPAKNWAPQNFARVADWVSERSRVLLISGPAEDGAAEIRLAMKKESPLVADNLPLINLAALIKTSTAYLGNDSGITHLAALCGIPTVAIFGPTDPTVWGPRGPEVQIIYGGKVPSPGLAAKGNKDPCFWWNRVQLDSVMEALAPFFKMK